MKNTTDKITGSINIIENFKIQNSNLIHIYESSYNHTLDFSINELKKQNSEYDQVLETLMEYKNHVDK